MPTQTNLLEELARILQNNSGGSRGFGERSTLTAQQQTLMNELVSGGGGGGASGGVAGLQGFNLQPGQPLNFGGMVDPTNRSVATGFQSIQPRRPGEPVARPSFQQQLDSRQSASSLVDPNSIEGLFQSGVADPARREFDRTVRPRIEEAFAKAGLGHSVGAGVGVARSLTQLNQGLASQLGRIQINLQSLRANLSQRETESRRGAILGALGQSHLALIEGEGDELSVSSKRAGFQERLSQRANRRRAQRSRRREARDVRGDKRQRELDTFRREKGAERAQEKSDKIERSRERKRRQKERVENTKSFKEGLKTKSKDNSDIRNQIIDLQKRIRETTDTSLQKRLKIEVLKLRDLLEGGV